MKMIVGYRELIRQEQYITENNYEKMYGIRSYCCEFNMYHNGIYYLRQFICYLPVRCCCWE